MPTYAYRCKKCGAQFERSMTIAEHDHARMSCPKCKSRAVEPVYSSFFAKTSRKS